MSRLALPKIVKTCEFCAGQFSCYPSEAPNRRYCSRSCHINGQRARGIKMGARRKFPHRPLTFNCEHCGKEAPYAQRKSAGKRNKGLIRQQRFCSRACANYARGPSLGTIHHTGYRYLSMGSRGNSIAEHREVMSRHIGRPLFKHETVHHKDGDRLNNEISNLELWSSRHGRGQRVEDKIAFAKSLLEEYGVANFPVALDDLVLGSLAMGG